MRKTMESLISAAKAREAKYREMADEVREQRREAAAMVLNSRVGLTCDRFGHVEKPKAYGKPPERPAMSDNIEIAVMVIIGLVSLLGLLILGGATGNL